ncbi:MAG: mannose-1-phosphate guanylyltransferase/mannose-6-phosphate isomerase [Burkholderiaceae bacterium]|jgi:mannose-1-phosphate guanylyltransferase|nr:mannose-1-phosphate guanylyltransferase/mannose-6-phosphate isomerase [Burkholderiaceae bacterium]
MDNSSLLIPVILCGGAGSRLWPVSRELHPKPFMRLSDGQSLLQKAFIRAIYLPGVTDILTVTNRELFFKTQDDFDEVNSSGITVSYILEPFGRNTAAAVAAAALRIAAEYGEDAVMLVLPADHIITDEAAFQQAVLRANRLAQTCKLVTFGIRPTGPETGYGYIEAKSEEVLRFVEKPTLEKAKEYISSGNFLWNAGMFCFTANSIIRQMETHCADILHAVRQCIDASSLKTGQGLTQLELSPPLFRNVPGDSIDYAVMEKSKDVAVVPCSIGWSDIGSWTAFGDLMAPDQDGNRIHGETALYNTRNCTICSDDRLVSAVGVENLIIIDTADALLVAEKSDVQHVRHIYNGLKNRNHEAYKLHRTVHRPWGTYTTLEEGDNFKIKRIEVDPGASLSLQLHYHRSEHWIVVSGMAKVTNGDTVLFVNTNESTYIPAGHRHRLENPGMLPLIIIEVQSGQYLGEDDIVRFEDAYDRTAANDAITH